MSSFKQRLSPAILLASASFGTAAVMGGIVIIDAPAAYAQEVNDTVSQVETSPDTFTLDLVKDGSSIPIKYLENDSVFFANYVDQYSSWESMNSDFSIGYLNPEFGNIEGASVTRTYEKGSLIAENGTEKGGSISYSDVMPTELVFDAYAEDGTTVLGEWSLNPQDYSLTFKSNGTKGTLESINYSFVVSAFKDYTETPLTIDMKQGGNTISGEVVSNATAGAGSDEAVINGIVTETVPSIPVTLAHTVNSDTFDHDLKNGSNTIVNFLKNDKPYSGSYVVEFKNEKGEWAPLSSGINVYMDGNEVGNGFLNNDGNLEILWNDPADGFTGGEIDPIQYKIINESKASSESLIMGSLVDTRVKDNQDPVSPSPEDPVDPAPEEPAPIFPGSGN